MFSHTPEKLGATRRVGFHPTTAHHHHRYPQNPTPSSLTLLDGEPRPPFPMICAIPVHSFRGMEQSDTTPTRRRPTAHKWHLTGVRPGPVLLVTGSGKALQGALKRLKSLPSLGYLRGELRVQPKPQGSDADLHLPLVAASEADAYWTILSAAAQLGMISGRGVPAKYHSQAVSAKVAA